MYTWDEMIEQRPADDEKRLIQLAVRALAEAQGNEPGVVFNELCVHLGPLREQHLREFAERQEQAAQ